MNVDLASARRLFADQGRECLRGLSIHKNGRKKPTSGH